MGTTMNTIIDAQEEIIDAIEAIEYDELDPKVSVFETVLREFTKSDFPCCIVDISSTETVELADNMFAPGTHHLVLTCFEQVSGGDITTARTTAINLLYKILEAVTLKIVDNNISYVETVLGSTKVSGAGVNIEVENPNSK